MNTTIFKNAKCIISTCSKEIIKIIPFFIIPFFIMSVLSMPVQAGILLDTVDIVSDQVTAVQKTANTVRVKVNGVRDEVDALPAKIKGATKTQLQTLPKTIQDQFEITLDPELVEQAKGAVVEVGKIVFDLKEKSDTFESNGECDAFRSSLTTIFTNLGNLSTSLATSVKLPVPVLPDLNLDGIPCNALLGPSLILTSELRDKIKVKTGNMTESIERLFTTFFGRGNQAPINPGTGDNDNVIFTKFCNRVVFKRDEIYADIIKMRSIAFLLHIVSSRIDPDEVSTLFDLPKLIPIIDEMEAGLWGFAGLTLGIPDVREKLGKGLGAIANTLDNIEGKVSGIHGECMDTYNQKILDDQQDVILANQTKILKLLSP